MSSPSGDTDYTTIAPDYNRYRRPDPTIAACIVQALGDARTVLNVGAGTGAYEPTDRDVTAVEPAADMRDRRPIDRPAIDAVAEQLPFADASFDAAMTTFSIHQWRDLRAGLAEMRRVTRGPVLILTCDPRALDRFWLNDYCPDVIAVEARRYPPIHTIAAALGGQLDVLNVPIPLRCTDGFQEAYYGRPEALLDPGARRACSAFSFIDEPAVARFVAALSFDLQSGAWDAARGALRRQPTFDGALRLIVGRR